MKRISLCVALFVTAAQPAWTDVPQEWKNWQYAAPIRTESGSGRRLVALLLPAFVTTRAAARWADVRVLDREAHEVPYVLRARQGGTTADWRATRVLEPSVVKDQYTQVLADVGTPARVHNSARLHLDNREDFLSWVEIAVGDDGRTWRVVRERAPIFSLRAAGMGEVLEVSYPDSTARYVRLRVLDGSRPYAIGAVDVAREVAQTEELVPTDVILVPANSAPQRTAWVSASSAPVVPVASVRFETTRAQFDRPVSVETSDDGKHWQHAAAGQIYRRQELGELRESLTVRIPEASAPQWRVTVFNHNDAPVPDLRPALDGIPRRVLFWQEPGQQYQLIYGNARAPAPRYEMATLTDPAELDTAIPVTLGAEQPNGGYTSPEPWTERHPFVLWIAVIAAVAVLGVFAIRTLRAA